MRKYLLTIAIILLIPCMAFAGGRFNLAAPSAPGGAGSDTTAVHYYTTSDPKVYFVNALTGGADGALDNIPVASLTDGDIAIYGYQFSETGSVSIYIFDAEATHAESTGENLTFIRPDDYATAGVWLLPNTKLGYQAYLAGTGPALYFHDTDSPGSQAMGYIEFSYIDGGAGAENGDISIRVMQDGTYTTKVLEFDESDDQWETTKTIDAGGLEISGTSVYYPGGTDVVDGDVANDLTINSTKAITTTSTISAGADPADTGDLRLPNGAVIGFEDGTEGTITHIDNVGLRLPDDFEWQFGASGDARMEWNNTNSTFDFLQSDGTWKFKFDFANTAFLVAATAAPENGYYDVDAVGTDRADEYAGGMGANFTAGAATLAVGDEDDEISDVWIAAMTGDDVDDADSSKEYVFYWDGSLYQMTLGDDAGDAAAEDLLIDFDTATENEINISSNTGVTNIDFNAISMATTGTITGRSKVETDADGKTLDANDLTGSMQMATGAGTWVIPDVDAAAGTGYVFCVYSTTAAAVVINPDDEDKIRLNGTLLAAGDSITSASAAGDFVCLMLTDFDTNIAHWTTLGRSGTWTDTN